MTDKTRYTRRGFLAGTSGVIGTALASTSVSAQNRTTRQMVTRRSKLFKNNYVGQFVIVADVKKKQATPDVISNCRFPNWKPENTRVYDAVFIDNLGKNSESEQSVRTNIYTNGTKQKIDIGQPFIINNTHSCSSKYIGLEAQSIPTYAANGQPMGPTVSGTDEENTSTTGSGGTTTNESGQPGFGVFAGLAGLAGISGVGVKRALEEE